VHMSSLGVYSPGPHDRRVDESWPRNGIDSLPYSRHKVAAERLLDEHEHAGNRVPIIARMRPGVVVQADAGGALLRYGLPAYLPAALLRHVPLLPVDRSLVMPIVHSEDVADAVVRVLERRATGAFNLAAEPPITRDVIARALGARPVHLPRVILRTAANLACNYTCNRWTRAGSTLPSRCRCSTPAEPSASSSGSPASPPTPLSPRSYPQ